MKASIIGLGHAGIVISVGLANAGHDVLGVDLDHERIRMLRSGSVPIYEPGLQIALTLAVTGGNLRFAHRAEVNESLGDAVIIATGTPPTPTGAVDLQQVKSALRWIRASHCSGFVLVMKSTVPPGTGEGLVAHDLRGLDIKYVSSPEFLRAGHAVQDWNEPCRIVVGVQQGDQSSVSLVRELHRGIDAPYLVTDITSAEMIKYASNALLATRISFINEIALLCERLGASIDEVSEALSMDARTGTRIHAGLGFGGSCLPKDVSALRHLASANGVEMELLESVTSVNERQRFLPIHALGNRFPGKLNTLTVGVLGLAFKPETSDVRESPSLALIETLVHRGTRVRAYDSRATETARRLLPQSVEFVDTPVEAAEQAQALVLVTEWEDIIKADWSDISHCMLPPKFVLDGRNALDPPSIRQMGFEYLGVGRGSSLTEIDDRNHVQGILSYT